ncbi:hypothetical protein [Sphingomicrobium nitratireducens]|uniref:hypothetical protein n=1 Tax=Sphingomicrobium nitratireducens TaxID=2964666 RepID=UPI00223FDED3|nr:hypothetical protein [Sphingomicrobium nitratireducens]
MKAFGRTFVIIRFDADATRGLRREQVDHLTYHVTRLLTGNGTAESEWHYLGFSIEVEPDTDQGDEA